VINFCRVVLLGTYSQSCSLFWQPVHGHQGQSSGITHSSSPL